jgi:hypothetical protein
MMERLAEVLADESDGSVRASDHIIRYMHPGRCYSVRRFLLPR